MSTSECDEWCLLKVNVDFYRISFIRVHYATNVQHVSSDIASTVKFHVKDNLRLQFAFNYASFGL